MPEASSPVSEKRRRLWWRKLGKIPQGVEWHRPEGKWAPHLGHPNLYEVLWLVPTLLKAKTCVEVGTENGNSTCMIGDAMRRNGGRLWTVDVNDCQLAKSKIIELGLQDHVSFHHKSGQEFFQNWTQPIDFAFEDSEHGYRNTLEVLEAFHKHVRIGGVIAVHDLNIPAVPRAIADFLNGKDYAMVRSEWGPGFAYMVREC